MKNVNDALKDLYTRLIDSRDGYEQSMELVKTPYIKSTLEELHERRTANAAQLRSYLADRDVQLDDDGSILASAHRGFLQLKSMVTSGDDAVMAEILRGEKELRDSYDEAIADATGATPEFDFLNEQYTKLTDKISELETVEKQAA